MEGKGRYVFANGNSYEGGFKDGMYVERQAKLLNNSLIGFTERERYLSKTEENSKRNGSKGKQLQ
jgi:hypothetical protein